MLSKIELCLSELLKMALALTCLPLQLMASGDPGLPGLLAASHVAQEQDLDTEDVTGLPLLVVAEVVQDQAPGEKTVTHKHVQVILLIVFYIQSNRMYNVFFSSEMRVRLDSVSAHKKVLQVIRNPSGEVSCRECL